jgi:hypothetical protein
MGLPFGLGKIKVVLLGPLVNRHLKVYQFWESKSVPPDGVERAYAGKVDTISPPSLGYDLLKPWSFNR